jgi:transcriptional regulator with XRE-family HTH domain
MPKKQLRKPTRSLRRILAANLRSFRRERQISQEELADLCGLHRTYIGSVERAERNVTLSTLEVLAKVLGVSVPELLTPGGHDNSTSD